MRGIDINNPMYYRHSSMRFFGPNEKHIQRSCPDDVLLLVFNGVLRFNESGQEYEVSPGEYHIQKHGSYQFATKASDQPQYLYIHFYSDWTDSDDCLEYRGVYDYEKLKPYMEQMDYLSHSETSYLEKSALFYHILLLLIPPKKCDSTAQKIKRYLLSNYTKNITLGDISENIHFSKNHIISVFKKEYGITPFEFINQQKIQKAKYFLERTSEPLESIAIECGFNNYSHFYRLFVRYNGHSPLEWRYRNRINPSASNHPE